MQEAFRNSKERKAGDLEQSPISYVSLPDVLPERIGSPASFCTVVPVAAWIIVNPFDCSSDAKDTITTAKVIYHPLHTDM